MEAGLGRDLDRVRRVEADHVLDLLLDALGLGGRQVDLVEHGHDLMPRVEGVIDIRERLRFDPLAGVDNQKRAFASGERSRHLVSEVDMAGRVHEVEDIKLAIVGPVFEPDRLRLDGDAALALDVHGIEHLLDHLPLGDRPRLLDEPVGERRFAVVDVSDDREVSDILDRVDGHGARDSRAGAGRERDSGLEALDPGQSAPERRRTVRLPKRHEGPRGLHPTRPFDCSGLSGRPRRRLATPPLSSARARSDR